MATASVTAKSPLAPDAHCSQQGTVTRREPARLGPVPALPEMPFGTAIPLSLIAAEPPAGDDELLAWLANQEEEHRAEIRAAWEVILGAPPPR